MPTPPPHPEPDSAPPPAVDPLAPTLPHGRQHPTRPTRPTQIVAPVVVTSASSPDTLAATMEKGLGKYELGEELGRGGIGQVIAARDPALCRDLAIKMLLDAGSEFDRQGFIEEAQITGQLEHPNIVPVHELGIDATGRPYLAMKRIGGRSLREVIAEAHCQRLAGDSPISWPAHIRRLLDIFSKVCDAVSYAHSRGVIHRDLKPENVMVGEFGEVLVVDWGLAKPLGRPDGGASAVVSTRRLESADLTMQGEIFGTPAYMPPEQARGDVAAMDARADIYSLGAILYAMLAGVAPFAGPVNAVLDAVMAGDFDAPSRRENLRPGDVPRELEAAILQAMAREPAGRYASVAEFRADIDAFLDGRTLRAADYSLAQLLGKWAMRHKAIVATSGLSLAVLVAVVVVFVVWLSDERNTAITERNRADDEAAAAREAETRAREAESVAKSEAESARRADAETQRTLAQAMAFRGELAAKAGDARAAIAWLGHTHNSRARAIRWLVPPPVAVPLRPIFHGEYGARALAFSVDGSRIAVGSYGDFVWVDAATGAELGRCTHAGSHFALAPDESWVALPDDQGRIVLRDARSLDVLAQLEADDHRGVADILAVSPDGKFLFSAGTDAALKIWDMTARAYFGALRGDHDFTAFAVTPDSRQLIYAREDGSLWRLDLVEMRGAGQIADDVPGPYRCHALVISPDGRLLAAGIHSDIHLWTLADGAKIGTLRGHTSPIAGLAFAVDGRLISASRDRTVRLWDVAGQRELAVIPHAAELACVAAHPRLPIIATGPNKATARVWDIRDRAAVSAFAIPDANPTLAFSPDGEWLAVGGYDMTLVKLRGARERVVMPMAGTMVAQGNRVEFSATGDLVVLATHRLRIFDAATQDLRHDTELPERLNTDIAPLPDGRVMVATRAGDVLVHVPGTADFAPVIGNLPMGDMRLAVSADGEWFATVTGSGSLGIHAIRTGDTEIIDGIDDLGTRAVAFSPDGRWLAVGIYTGEIHLVDWPTRRVTRAMTGHGGAIAALAFSPDAEFLASASDDGTCRVWEMATSREMAVLRGESAAMGDVAFSPDGELIATITTDGAVRIWGGWAVPDRAFAERLTGFTVAGFDLVPLSAAEEAARIARWPEVPLVWHAPDIAAARFWPAYWRLRRAIDANAKAADRAEFVAATIAVRDWLAIYPTHPLAARAGDLLPPQTGPVR